MPRKEKRKARKKLVKKVNIIEPVPLDKLGTSEDPCFGKLHDPRNEICQRCGDAEICAIAMGQSNHLLRAALEEKSNFKDLEEKDIKPKESKSEMLKAIRARMKEMIKNGPVTTEDILLDLFAQFGRDGFTKPRLKKILLRLEEKNKFITKTKDTYKWKKSQ